MQTYIVVSVETGKLFESLTMIRANTQTYHRPENTWRDLHGGSGKEHRTYMAGPALRDGHGKEHIKNGGWFPSEVSKLGARVRVQDAQASWAVDKISIIREIVQDHDPLTELPTEHWRLDEVNKAVRALYRGAAMYSYAMNGETDELRKLLTEGSEGVNYQAAADKATPLWIAAANGYTEAVQLLAQHGASVNQAASDGQTPVWISAVGGYTETIKVLADLGADVNHDNGGKISPPAQISALGGFTETIKVLADLGVDVNQVDRWNGGTLIFASALRGHTETVKVLADLGADVNQADNDGWTPVCASAEGGYTETVKVLADLGADVNQANNDGDTPLYRAKRFEHSATVEVLLAAGAK